MTARALAVAQTVPRRGDVAANTAEHVELARAAAERGAGLVLFPELSLTGYELDLAAELAFAEDDARLEPLREAAAALDAVLVAGAPARIGAVLHIGAFVVAPDGTLELYTKRHLGAFPADANPGGPVPPPEPSVFAPGARDPLVPLGDHVAAVGVCADTGHPEHAARAAERGAGTYLASVFVIPAHLDEQVALLEGYARRHEMVVAMANFGGPTGGLPAAGASAIWAPGGELLVRLAAGGPGLAVAFERDGGWRAHAVELPG